MVLSSFCSRLSILKNDKREEKMELSFFKTEPSSLKEESSFFFSQLLILKMETCEERKELMFFRPTVYFFGIIAATKKRN
ncbi:MAG: hypothetical protein D3914_02860 [Candidatus Electrothrix sp. LOE2]|nr:hypothetical protein [Candidatus Electrothrix sp. LOE2]